MVKDKIKKWFIDTINLSMDANNDVNVDIARANYQKYQDELEQKRKDYVKTLCKRIKVASRDGYQFIKTANLLDDFMTYEFMMELKEYFEQRGFNVKEEDSSTGAISSYLKISWH